MTTVATTTAGQARSAAAANQGPNDPLPIAAVQADAACFPGFRQRFIETTGLEADRNAGRRISPPLLALWGEKGTVGRMSDVVGMCRQEAAGVSGHGLPCGPLIPEEDPDGLIASLGSFRRPA